MPRSVVMFKSLHLVELCTLMSAFYVFTADNFNQLKDISV